MKNVIVLLCLIFATQGLYCQTINYNPCDKLILINSIINKPDSIKEIVMNSEFFSEKVNYDLSIKSYNKINIVDILKSFSGQCVLTRFANWNPHLSGCNFDDIGNCTMDEFTLNYLGGDTDLYPYINFTFFFVNGKWIIREINTGIPIKLLSADDTSYYKNFYNDTTRVLKTFRTNKIIEKQKAPYLNYDYSACEKYELINTLLENPTKLESLLKSSNFTKNNPTFKKNYDSSYKILKDYLTRFKNKIIVFNYPFPVHTKNILPFLNDKPKDYFIIRFNNYPENLYTRSVTVIFEKSNKEWKLINIKRGSDVYLGMGRKQILPPYE